MQRPPPGGRLRKICWLDESFLPEWLGEFLGNGSGEVFPPLLFGIKRMIGPVQQLLLRLAIFVVRKPSRKTKRHFSGLELDRKIRQPLQHQLDLLRITLRQQHHKFVAANPHRQIRPPNRPAQPLAKRLQRQIARRMPVRVVDLLQLDISASNRSCA